MLTPKRKSGEYHHGDLKQAAILAARKLVAGKGVIGLGIRKVATLTGVTPAALYRHFEDLDDLVFSLSENIRAELGQRLSSAVEGVRDEDFDSSIQRLKIIGATYIDFAEENPKLFGTAFLNRDDSTIEDYTELAWVLLREEVSKLIERGSLTASLLPQLQMTLWSLVHGCASLVASQALSTREIEAFKISVARGIELLCRA